MLEKLMCARLDSYLKSNSILYFMYTQKFYRYIVENIEFLDYVYSSLDEKQSTIAVYLDFSKALVTVNYDTLMSKFQHN